jgi:hypothetical protein
MIGGRVIGSSIVENDVRPTGAEVGSGGIGSGESERSGFDFDWFRGPEE